LEQVQRPVTEFSPPGPAASDRTWWVEARGEAYGPYTMTQLSRFLAEGRVKPTSRVSENGEDGWVEARQVIGLMASARGANDNDLDGANIFVHADIQSGAWHAFQAALESMGAVCELSPNLWLVRSRHTAGVVRNTLSQTLHRGDRFVVIDASRDRFAWYNLGPGIDVRVAKVWKAPLKTAPR
jgi:GYF domain 2